jgi:acetyl esterase/lipase
MKNFLIAITFLIIAQFNSIAQSNAAFDKLTYTYAIKKSDTLKVYVFNSTHQKNSKIKPAMVIFHGGGWSVGKPSWAFGLAERFADKGFTTFAVQYRLSNQDNISPIDAMSDAKESIIWLKNNARELHVDSNKIVVYGWSAGSHLAASTAIFPISDEKSGASSIPNALILSSPALSLVNDNWFEQLLPSNEKVLDYSPAENLNTKIPPSIILVGADDTVTPAEQAQLFYEKAKSKGSLSEIHIYRNVGHLFTPSDRPDNNRPDPDKDTVKEALEAIDVFLNELGFNF